MLFLKNAETVLSSRVFCWFEPFVVFETATVELPITLNNLLWDGHGAHDGLHDEKISTIHDRPPTGHSSGYLLRSLKTIQSFVLK